MNDLSDLSGMFDIGMGVGIGSFVANLLQLGLYLKYGLILLVILLVIKMIQVGKENA